MKCSDWQRRIAGDELDDAAVAEHIAVCGECREFSDDLAENAAALRSIEVDAAAYTALRARVMEAVRPRRRFGWLWAGAAAAVAAVAVVFWWTAPLRVPDAQRPAALVYRIEAPRPTIAAKAIIAKRMRKAGSPKPQLNAIKILTDDPNVVIIWLVDKKGD